MKLIKRKKKDPQPPEGPFVIVVSADLCDFDMQPAMVDIMWPDGTINALCVDHGLFVQQALAEIDELEPA